MNTSYPLVLSLNIFDKILLSIVFLMILMTLIKFVSTQLQKKKNDQMIKTYLSIKNDKYDELVAILKNPNDITASELKNNIQLDLSKLDSRYKDILKADLNKIKDTHQVNSWNWQFLSRVLN